MADCQYCNKGHRYENTDLSFGQRVHVRTDATMTGVVNHIHSCKEYSWLPYRVEFDDNSASASYAADELVALDKEPKYKIGDRVFINSKGHSPGKTCPQAGKYATIKLVHEERWRREPSYTVWVDGQSTESFNFEESHLDKAALPPENTNIVPNAKFTRYQRVKLAGVGKPLYDWQSGTIQDMTYREGGYWSYKVLYDNDAEGWYSERGLEAFEPEPKFTKDQRVRVTDTNSNHSQDGTIVSVQQHWPTSDVWSYHVKFDNGDYGWYAESVLVELPPKPSPKLIVVPDEYWPQFLEFCETNGLPLKSLKDAVE